jgi:hypothetical protein
MHTPNYRFSGHETFVCRYAWLPKAVNEVSRDKMILTLSREDDAMVQLGVGKNMVRSIRFWAEATGVIEQDDQGHRVTGFGAEVFLGGRCKFARECYEPIDPYLEDIQTLWLLHWRLATNRKHLIFSWDFLLNRFQEPELYASTVIRAFSKADPAGSASAGSLEQLWEVFLHSYVPTLARKGEVREDNLDCPLTELGLLSQTGVTESSIRPGRVEPKYAFRREDKPEISQALFVFCLQEFWQEYYPNEQSIPLHAVAIGYGSPGQVFKIPELEIQNRLFGIEDASEGALLFEESASVPRIVRGNQTKGQALRKIYRMETVS